MTLTFAPDQPRTHLGVLLYGPTGAGKTVAAASAPGPILYLNADGPGALRYARRRFPDKQIREVTVNEDEIADAHSRQTLQDAFLYVRDGNDIQTVVLDSLGRIYDVVLQDIAKDDRHPTLPERGDANTFLERLVLAYLELPVNLVLVAHDNPVVVTGSEDEGTASVELFPFTGTAKPTLAKKIMRPLDVVAFCGRVEPETDDASPRWVGQLYNAGGRHGKDRTAVIGDVADLDLSVWVEANEAAYAPATAPNGKPKTEKKEKS